MATFHSGIDVQSPALFGCGPVLGKKQARLSVGQVEHVADVVPLEAHTVDLIGELLREAHLHVSDGSKHRTRIDEVIDAALLCLSSLN